MRLNVSTLSGLNSLCILLVSPLVCAPDHLQPIPIWTLVDSGFTHCFLDSAFARRHSLPITPTLPVELHLFDRTSNNIISEVVSLPVTFLLCYSTWFLLFSGLRLLLPATIHWLTGFLDQYLSDYHLYFKVQWWGIKRNWSQNKSDNKWESKQSSRCFTIVR